MNNIIEKTNLIANFVEKLGEASNEARRAKIGQVCGTARYLAEKIYWEDDDIHPEYLEAYLLVYNEALRTLRWYVKELQPEDRLSRKQEGKRTPRRPRRIVSKD